MSRPKIVAVALVAALALAATAGAGRPSGTASASVAQVGPCSLLVTYTWNGFKGRGVVAYFGAFYKLDLTARYWVFDWVSASPAGGSVTATFDLSGKGEHDWYAGGHLADSRGRVLDGSSASSPDTTPVHLSCP